MNYEIHAITNYKYFEQLQHSPRAFAMPRITRRHRTHFALSSNANLQYQHDTLLRSQQISLIPPNPAYKSRYYLHQRVKLSFKYSAAEKTIYVSYSKQNEALQNKYVRALRDKYHYSLQLEIE